MGQKDILELFAEHCQIRMRSNSFQLFGKTFICSKLLGKRGIGVKIWYMCDFSYVSPPVVPLCGISRYVTNKSCNNFENNLSDFVYNFRDFLYIWQSDIQLGLSTFLYLCLSLFQTKEKAPPRPQQHPVPPKASAMYTCESVALCGTVI